MCGAHATVWGSSTSGPYEAVFPTVTIINASETFTTTVTYLQYAAIPLENAESPIATSQQATQSHDTSLKTSSTPAGTSRPTNTDLSPTGRVAQESSNNSTGTNLSTGAKTGIGVGSAVGALALIALLISTFWWRWKARKRIAANDANFEKAELSGDAKGKADE